MFPPMFHPFSIKIYQSIVWGIVAMLSVCCLVICICILSLKSTYADHQTMHRCHQTSIITMRDTTLQLIWIENGWNNFLQGKKITLLGGYWWYEKYDYIGSLKSAEIIKYYLNKSSTYDLISCHAVAVMHSGQ